MTIEKKNSFDKEISLEEALSLIKDGSSIMIGGFASSGSPEMLIKGLIDKGVKNLTLINNDTGYPHRGVALLVEAKMIKKAIVSHIGTNPETVKMHAAGEIEVELVPQGTFIERIRCGGFGLGGVLTPTGVGTEVETGKQKIEVDGKMYLLEKSLKADFAIIKAKKADRMGNVIYHGTNVAHNPMMATAAAVTIVQAEEIVEVGELDPDHIHTPSVFVNYIVKGE